MPNYATYHVGLYILLFLFLIILIFLIIIIIITFASVNICKGCHLRDPDKTANIAMPRALLETTEMLSR